MALKSQSYAWVKNWLTEKLSGRQGFSGEFNYARQNYLDEKTKRFKKTEKVRKWWSLGIGFGGALLFPLAILAVVKSKGNSRLMQGLKKRLKAFDYTQAIYMSKWVLLVSKLTNWEPATILSS